MPEPVPGVSVDLAAVLAVAVLLAQFALLRVLAVEAFVRIYAIQSLAVCTFTASVGHLSGSGDLYLLAALTLLTKVVVIPIAVTAIVTRLGVEDRVPASIPVPQSLLLGAAVATLGFVAASRVHGVLASPADGLGAGLAVVLMGFLTMVARPNAVAQLVGYLALENGIFVAGLSLAPGLPLIVAVLLLVDVLLPASAFVVVIRLLAVRVRSAHTETLTELRG